MGDLGSQSRHLCGQNGLAQGVRREGEKGWARKQPCWGQIVFVGIKEVASGHLWTRGSVQAWIKLQDTPQASHQQVKGNLEVSQP